MLDVKGKDEQQEEERFHIAPQTGSFVEACRKNGSVLAADSQRSAAVQKRVLAELR